MKNHVIYFACAVVGSLAFACVYWGAMRLYPPVESLPGVTFIVTSKSQLMAGPAAAGVAGIGCLLFTYYWLRRREEQGRNMPKALNILLALISGLLVGCALFDAVARLAIHLFPPVFILDGKERHVMPTGQLLIAFLVAVSTGLLTVGYVYRALGKVRPTVK